jgi:hypothetical protein
MPCLDGLVGGGGGWVVVAVWYKTVSSQGNAGFEFVKATELIALGLGSNNIGDGVVLTIVPWSRRASTMLR